ncbi:MAG: hypothetical protein A3F82_08290 [Deltaproteobacteria bacterium RIFCSPLOWO2_12_FULL_44_12]|nr:MAG: hypothetical protein A3F82_08290 [Deltaproteobacteria bacterium RIFCSPLOWO2_12_FULL_44_12]
MKTTLTIAKRELKAYFATPIAYVFLITFLGVVHWLFLRNFFLIGQNNLRPFFSFMPWIYLFFVPAIAMGKWAEERKQGTIELLFTMPLKAVDVLIGKFLAGLGLIAIALFFTFPLLVTIIWLGDVDAGPIIGGYLGLLFMGGAYLSIGLWVSSLTDNQIIAFILGVVACFGLLIIGESFATMDLPTSLTSFLQYLGLATHFDSIGRGVIDSKDILYYLSVIGIFLFFNLKSLEGSSRWTLILTAIIGLFTFNLLAANHFVRLDLTQNKIYTLAPATKNILKTLDDLVTIRLYFTKDLPPALMGLKRDVEDILSEFKTYSEGRIKIEFLDPQENPVKEQQIQMMGIPPIEVNVIAKDKQELAKIYLGLTVNFSGKQEVLPVVQNISNLEYRLADAIVKVTNPKKPVVGWWGPTPHIAGPETPESVAGESYQMALEKLRSRYDIRTISDTNLKQLDPQEMPTLLFIVPNQLTDAQKTAFTQYAEKGGKTILLVEKVSVGLNAGLRPTPQEIPLQDFLKTYGIEIGQELVVDRSNAMATFVGGMVNYHLPYPYWILIRSENFNKEQPFVAELNSLILPWSSPILLSEKAPEGVTITELFKTTQYGVKSSVDPGTPLLPDISNNVISEGTPGHHTLGIFVTKKNAESPETQMIVISNANFLKNIFLQQFPENEVFMENAVDFFATGSQLIGIRSKGILNQPIAILSDGARTTIKIIDIFISPILIIGIGIGMIFWRRTRARLLQAAYAKKT